MAAAPAVSSPAPAAPAAPATSGWPASAALAYTLGLHAGLTPAQALDFASVQYGESGFNPNAQNSSSGAAGLYQLLSSGYVNKANALGGVFNPTANIDAILPNYQGYYASHPGAVVPGAAGSAVEASGEPASYYAQGYQHLSGAPPVGAEAPQVAPTVTDPHVQRLLAMAAGPTIPQGARPQSSPLLALARSLLA